MFHSLKPKTNLDTLLLPIFFRII